MGWAKDRVWLLNVATSEESGRTVMGYAGAVRKRRSWSVSITDEPRTCSRRQQRWHFESQLSESISKAAIMLQRGTIQVWRDALFARISCNTGFLSKWFFKQTRPTIEGLGLIHCSGIDMNERMEMQFAKIVTISQFYLLICSCLLILPIQVIVEDQHWFDPLS
jgi:hypothetical protein